MLLEPVQACDLSLNPPTHSVLFNTTAGIHRRAAIRLCCILPVCILASFEGLGPLGVWGQVFVGGGRLYAPAAKCEVGPRPHPN